MLRRQIQDYINQDPATKHQKCLPMGVFKKHYSNRATPLSTDIGQLAVEALFFGMRSCEYSAVSGARKTRTLTVRDVRVFRHHKEISQSVNMPLHKATTVLICFTRQKNNEKEAVITMHRTRRDLCPVQAWGAIIQRVLSYLNSSHDSPVNLVQLDTKGTKSLHLVKATQVLAHIRNTVRQLGPTSLGFTEKEVGTHSIRRSFAMMLHVLGIPSGKIMLQGRWRNTAFLTYIRVQVTQFSDGLSDHMVKNRDFYSVPDIDYDVCSTYDVTSLQSPKPALWRFKVPASASDYQ